MAAYRFLFNRLYQLPLSQKQRLHEMKIIHQIAKNNGYPINIIERLNSQIKNKFENPHTTPQTQQKTKKWAIFEYHYPIIQKVTNIFKGTDLHITYQVKNTTQRIFNEYDSKPETYENGGIYSLKCNTFNLQYVGQTGRNLKARYLEHCRYIKSNDPKSAYALHILNNKHEYGTIYSTTTLIKTCKKGWRMNTLENFYIQQFHQNGSLIREQQQGEENLLFKIIKPPLVPAHAQKPNLTNTT